MRYSILKTAGKDKDGDYRGMTDFDAAKIRICKTMPLEAQKQTLLHEMAHVWLDNAGIEYTRSTHIILDVFASGLVAALQDNPALIDYLREKGNANAK